MTQFAKAWVAGSAAAMIPAAAQPASAAVFFFTSRSAFDAAVSGGVDHDFNSVSLTGDVSVEGPQSVDGVTFSSNGLAYVYGTGIIADYGQSFFTGQSPSENNPANAVSIDLGLAGLQAFGFTYGSFGSLSEAYRATLNTGDLFDFATPGAYGETGFLGFVSDGALLTTADLVSQAPDGGLNGFSLDVTSFVTVAPVTNSAVPEPSSWLMMIAGFGLLGASMRRRSREALAHA